VIIFRGNSVHGLTTAASLWAVAGVGLAAGGGLYGPAIVGTAFMFLILAGMKPVERKFFARHARQHRIVLELAPGASVLEEIQAAFNGGGAQLQSLDFDFGDEDDHDTVELAIRVNDEADVGQVIARLRDVEGVRRLTWRHGSSVLRKRVRATGNEGGRS
jgi:putative Mg2+ transporter-C (MgtC) family protein